MYFSYMLSSLLEWPFIPSAGEERPTHPFKIHHKYTFHGQFIHLFNRHLLKCFLLHGNGTQWQHLIHFDYFNYVLLYFSSTDLEFFKANGCIFDFCNTFSFISFIPLDSQLGDTYPTDTDCWIIINFWRCGYYIPWIQNCYSLTV